MEPLYNGHHWDQRFILYSEVSFAQGVIVDHAPLTIVANYAGARLWTMKSVVPIKNLLILALRQESRTYMYLGYNYCNCRSLILTDVNGGCG